MSEGKKKDDTSPDDIEAETTPVYEEDAVAALHSHADSKELPLQPKQLHVEALGRFTKNLSQLEFYPLYERYQKGEVPTLADIRATIEHIQTEVAGMQEARETEGDEMAEELRASKLLTNRAEGIERSVNRYVQTVIRFHNVKRISRVRLEERPELMEEVDRARRTAHNALIESLRVFANAVQTVAELGSSKVQKIVEWDPAHPLKRADKKEVRLVTFSKKFLDDRDLIRNWAMVIDYAQKMEVIEQALKE